MELTWRSTLLLAVLAGVTTWYLEQKLAGVVSDVAAPVVSAVHGAVEADPLAGGSVWNTLKDSVEVPMGASSAAVDRWVTGT